MRPAELLQSLSIPAWKWEDFSMDFIVGPPLADLKFNYIWVIVDQFTKSAHSIPVHAFYRADKNTKLNVSRILCWHVVPKTIIFDRGP
jgi:hypothetical protein